MLKIKSQYGFGVHITNIIPQLNTLTSAYNIGRNEKIPSCQLFLAFSFPVRHNSQNEIMNRKNARLR